MSRSESRKMDVVVEPDFFKVDAGDIEALSRVVNIPPALEAYWRAYGHGFFIEDDGGRLLSDSVANRLIDPMEVLDLLQSATDLAIEFEHGFPFFEMNDRRYLLLSALGRVVSAEVDVEVIFQSFDEFMYRIVREPFFYDEVEEDDDC